MPKVEFKEENLGLKEFIEKYPDAEPWEFIKTKPEWCQEIMVKMMLTDGTLSIIFKHLPEVIKEVMK